MGSIFNVFFRKENSTRRTYDINELFLEQLVYLNENVYDASMNKLVSVCIRDLIETEAVNLYTSAKKENLVRHSFYIKDSLIAGLEKLNDKYPISIGKLVNIAIHNALEQEKEHLKNFLP